MKSAQPKIVVVGSFMMDLVVRAPRRPSKGETLVGSEFAMFPGGKGANQAVASARLGARVSMVGRVGRDMFGEIFLSALAQEGIDTRHVGIDPELGTGVGAPLIDEEGDNSIVIVPRANLRVCPDDIESARDAIVGADVLLLQLEVPLEASMHAASIARQAGVKVILNPAPARAFPLEFAVLVDVIVPNEVEAWQLSGFRVVDFDTAREAAKHIVNLGPGACVMTLGALGAYVVSGDTHVHVCAPHVEEVVDTTAAGDAFCGALGVSLARNMDLVDAVRFACKAGAFAVTRMGAFPSLPRLTDIAAEVIE